MVATEERTYWSIVYIFRWEKRKNMKKSKEASTKMMYQMIIYVNYGSSERRRLSTNCVKWSDNRWFLAVICSLVFFFCLILLFVLFTLFYAIWIVINDEFNMWYVILLFSFVALEQNQWIDNKIIEFCVSFLYVFRKLS